MVAPAGPVLISAGAGTGKTRTVTARIAFRVADRQLPPGAILAVTHSTRAAGNLREGLRSFRVAELERVATRTIHAAALNQLRYAAAVLGIGAEPAVSSDQFATVREICNRIKPGASPSVVGTLVSEIAWAKVQMLTAQTYADSPTTAQRRLPVDVDRFVEVFSRYDASLQRRGLLDHTDILTSARTQVLEHASLAADVRRRSQFLLVDEYQDTDPAQHSLLRAWLGDRDDITVVGDARQAIYAFKGSDPQILAGFGAQFADAHVVDLTTNYRSSTQILQVANALARTLPGLSDAVDLTAASAPGPAPRVRALATAQQEESWVVAQVAARLRAGTAPAQVAVLVRDNQRATRIGALLEEAGVPALVSGATRFFEAPEIGAVRTLMREELARGTDLSGPALLRQVLADVGFDRARPAAAAGAAAPVWRTRMALLEWVEGLPAAEMLGAGHLLAELDAAARGGHQLAVDAVFVGTVHAAKGLEFDVVFSLGWDQSWSDRDQDGNLAYVALTRARRELTLTWARQRGERTVAVSPLVARAGFCPVDDDNQLPGSGESVPRRRSPRRDPAATRSIACRRCRAALPPGAETLRVCSQHLTGEHARVWADLLAWRSDQSVISGVPEYRVLTNASALALVAQAPTNATELSQIPGVGPVTVQRHGHALLDAVRDLVVAVP